MPLVSIIVPTYNHQDYVQETLESIFSQTFHDYEVIVVNDGSPDNTRSVLLPYTKSGRIRYIEQTNHGQAAARNHGLALSSGEFVAFLDDDDLWPSDKLEWQVDFLRKNPLVNAVGGRHLSAAPLYSPTTGDTRTELDVAALYRWAGFISPGAVLFRATCLREIGGFDPCLWGSDDYDLYLRVARVSPIVLVDRLALWYRLHESNASKQAGRLLHNVTKCLNSHLRQETLFASLKHRFRGASFVYGCIARNVIKSSARGRKPRLRAGLVVAKSMWQWLLCNPRVGLWFFREALWGIDRRKSPLPSRTREFSALQ